MVFPEIYSATGMMELIQKIGFLPLLDSDIEGFSAEDIVDEDCRYVTFPEGGWDWPLWKWKGEIVTEMPCMYGKFFNKKQDLSARNGGQISATTEEAKTLAQKKSLLKELSLAHYNILEVSLQGNYEQLAVSLVKE